MCYILPSGGAFTSGNWSSFPLDENGQASISDIYNFNTSNIDTNYSTTQHRSTAILMNKVNNHYWYGWLGTANYKYNEEWKFTGGLDVRYYAAQHWREVRNLLGGDYFIDMDNMNYDYTANPEAAMQAEGDKIDKDNEAFTRWFGLFGTGEYKKDKLYGYANLSLSSTGYKRFDYFLPEVDGEAAEIGWEDFWGFVVKGGANYNLTEALNVYGNLGYLNKPPIFDGVYADYNQAYENITNEKVYSVEGGINYKHPQRWLTTDAGVYYTYWQDRTWPNSFTGTDGFVYNYLMNGIDAIHRGIELSANSEITKWFSLYGMASFGNWEWAGNVEAIYSPDTNPEEADTLYAFVDGVKVGGAPQTTMALGANLYPFTGCYISAILTHFADHYADFDPTNLDTPDEGNPWEVPAYSVVDLHFGYKIPATFSNAKLQIFGHIYNIFDEQYITDATDGSSHDASTALVFFGRPRTWNFGFVVDL